MHLDGYKYWLAYTKGTKSYYRCSRSKSQKCPGKLIMEDSKVITMIPHDHEKESRNNVVEKFRKVLTKKAVEKPNKALVDIYVEETLNHSEASILYPFCQAESTMRKARSKILEEKRKVEEKCEIERNIEDKKAVGDGNCHKNEEKIAKKCQNSFNFDEKRAKNEEIFDGNFTEKNQTKKKKIQNQQRNAGINSQQHQKYFYVENISNNLKIILMNQGTMKILGKIEEIHIDCGMKVDVKEVKDEKTRQEQEILSKNVTCLESFASKILKNPSSDDKIKQNDQNLNLIDANISNDLAPNHSLRLGSHEISMETTSNYSFIDQNLQLNSSFSSEISLVNYENVSLVYDSYSEDKSHFMTLKNQGLSNITSKDEGSSFITSKNPDLTYMTSKDQNLSKNNFVIVENQNLPNLTSKDLNPNTSQFYELKTTEISTEQPMVVDFEIEKQAIGNYDEINIDFTSKTVKNLNLMESIKNNEPFPSESENLTQNSSQVQYYQEFIVSLGESPEIFEQNQQNMDKSFHNNFENPQILVQSCEAQNFNEGFTSQTELKVVNFEAQGPGKRNTDFSEDSNSHRNFLKNDENSSENFKKSQNLSQSSKTKEHNLKTSVHNPKILEDSKTFSNFPEILQHSQNLSRNLQSLSNVKHTKYNLKFETQRYHILTVIALVKGRDCPIAFGLLKYINYDELHQVLQLLKLKISLNPAIILTNQNEILQQAVCAIWSEATMKIMYFYYARSVLKNLQKNIQEITKNIFEISSLKMILSMPLIPTNYVIPGWEALRKWMNEKNVDLNRLCDDVYVKWLAENAERISIFNGLTHSINNHMQVFQTELINSFDGHGMKTENLVDKILRKATKNFTKFSKTSEISAKKIQKLQKTVKIATKSWISSPFHLRRPIQFLQQVSHCIDDGMINFVMNFDGNFIEIKKMEPPPLIFFAKEQNAGEKRENSDKRNKILLSSKPPPLVPIKRLLERS